MEKRDCAFQYAKVTGKIFQNIEIVSDENELTLDEAKELWNKYYPDLAKHIKNGETGEMAIWIDMVDGDTYGKTLHHISNDAESDGFIIWETKKITFPRQYV